MVRVFVAGATGVVGRPAVRGLVAAGHDVRGVARTPERARLLHEAGATPVTVDLFDAAAVARAVGDCDVAVNLATHIPAASRAAVPGAWAENDRIRRQVSANLAAAVIAGDAKRFVQESIVLIYAGRGDTWIDEDSPLAVHPVTRSVHDAEAQARTVTDAGKVGVVLRFGLFHGSEGTQMREFMRMLRMGLCPTLGSRDDFVPVISVDDAASAVVAAVELPSGAYNVVDDEPLRRHEYCQVLAEGVGRTAAKLPPQAMGRMKSARHLSQSLRVSNQRLKDVSGWRPRHSSIRESWRAAVEGLAKRGT